MTGEGEPREDDIDVHAAEARADLEALTRLLRMITEGHAGAKLPGVTIEFTDPILAQKVAEEWARLAELRVKKNRGPVVEESNPESA